MNRVRQQYEDRIRSRLGDLGVLQRITEAQIPLELENAIATLSKDAPPEREQSFAGDGTTFTFDLTADVNGGFELEWSRLLEAEYPAGERIPKFVELRNVSERAGVVTLHDLEPATGETIIFRYTGLWSFPTDTPADDEIPEIYFQAVCDLAGARLARAKGVEQARRQSNSVAGDLIQTNPEALFSAATALEKTYSDLVLGRGASSGGGGGSGSQPALLTNDVDVFPYSLFHGRRVSGG